MTLIKWSDRHQWEGWGTVCHAAMPSLSQGDDLGGCGQRSSLSPQGPSPQCTLAQPTPGIHFNLLTADPSASLAFGFFQWRDSSNGPDLLIMGFAQNRKLVLQRGWPRLISSESLAVAEASSAACAPFTGRGNYRKIKSMDCVALPFTCTRPQAPAPERSPLFRRFMFI